MIDVTSKDIVAAIKGVPLLIMNAQTIDETKSTVVCPGQGVRNHTLIIRVSANVTGKIQWETASFPEYTGLWSPFGGGTIDLSTIGAAGELILNFTDVMIDALRGRIETVVAGGNVSLLYSCS